MWCCGHANTGEKLLVQCSAVEIEDLEPRNLQVGKSYQCQPGHKSSQLPILQEDLSGSASKFESKPQEFSFALMCLPPPLISLFAEK